ncbi:hypothetical protein ACIPVK_03130 [Paeniglutamicibacter sp. MACA_103]|uniref:hypothetical protein n=1 Tax=Paeniglutamicibacter sp. MACA_103 TaxID=3377337 RepID=UPI003892E948
MVDQMHPFPRVAVGDAVIFVDQTRPVAVVRGPGLPDHPVSWPELDIGIISPEISLLSAPDAAWVVYAGCADEIGPTALGPHGIQDITAVRIGADGSVGHVGANRSRVLGATRHGLWTAPFEVLPIDESYSGGELPEGWAAPMALEVHMPTQATRRVEFDRQVESVGDEEAGTSFLVQPSPPVAHRDSDGFCFEYRRATLVLPVGAELPARVRFRDFVPQGWGELVEDRWEDEPSASSADPEDIDLDGIPGTRWNRAAPTAAQELAAVHGITGQFANMEAYWRDANGESFPIADGVSDARVDVEGQWPQTRVRISFRHPYYPGGRLRRSIRVFDEAGRIMIHEYAGIHLMEDLDTNDLPDIGEEHGSVLEI